jgi:hypothetical protein
MFGVRLHRPLFAAVVNHESQLNTLQEWVRAAQKHQQKYLLVRSVLGAKKQNNPNNQMRTQEQWRNAFKRKEIHASVILMPWTYPQDESVLGLSLLKNARN